MYLGFILGVPTVLVGVLTVYAWWGWGKRPVNEVSAEWKADHARRAGKAGYQQ